MDNWDNTIEKTAKILYMIAAKPNARRQPTSGDLPGDFHLWFDGGALRVDTGVTTYKFRDGTRAYIGVRPFINVQIVFPDGKDLELVERTDSTSAKLNSL